MKKHKTYETDTIGERMADEFNEVKSFREAVYIAHLYVEYYLNEILVKIFPHPAKIIDENELGTFKNKMLIIDSIGILEGKDALKNNLVLIQRIRNYYAHNITITDEIPDTIVNRIKQLVYICNGNPVTHDLPWEGDVDVFDSQFIMCAVETTNELVSLKNELGIFNPRKELAQSGSREH